LFGSNNGSPRWPLFTLRWIEKNELLDLSEFLQQLFHGQPGPSRPSLFVDVLEQGNTQHAVESVNVDLGVGPVIHRTPTEPVAIFKAAENLLDLLLTRLTGRNLFGCPVHAIGQQQGAAQAMSEEFLESGMIEIEL
jgi:hypothetical protein